MFAIITPALITGAFAERMKFSAMVAFLVWSIMVYAPMAHMVWGKGGLLNAALGGRFPTLDFAGGTVVHITSGVSALVCAVYMGKRAGYPNTPMPPHSVVLSFVGASLLWVGVVWIQCRQRARLRQPGYQCVRSHPFWSSSSRGRMERDGMVAQRKTECVRRHFRCGRRSGGDYACFRVRDSAFGTGHWTYSGRYMLFDGRQGEGPPWL